MKSKYLVGIIPDKPVFDPNDFFFYKKALGGILIFDPEIYYAYLKVNCEK